MEVGKQYKFFHFFPQQLPFYTNYSPFFRYSHILKPLTHHRIIFVKTLLLPRNHDRIARNYVKGAAFHGTKCSFPSDG